MEDIRTEVHKDASIEHVFDVAAPAVRRGEVRQQGPKR